MKKIGFIGLGIMGKPMCRNLLKAGFELVVHNRSKAAVEELVEAGAKSAGSAKEVAQSCEMLITMLPNSPDVRLVALGPDGIAEGATPGLIVADMSSIAPLAAREIAKELAAKGVRFLDAPVSGGEPKAVDGSLSVMVGADLETFELCKPVFAAMAASVVRVGEVGAGNTAKLCNQIIVALNIAAVSEAFTLAAKAGVEPELVFQAIRGGLAGSTVLEAKAPLMLARQFKPGFRINLHQKDLGNVLETSHALSTPLPLTASVMEMLTALSAAGEGGLDHSGLLKFYENLAKVEVKGKS